MYATCFHPCFWQFTMFCSRYASIITTTGYATVDFNQWPEFSKCIVLLLMFIGACAGSTGGGIKVSRIMMAFKEAKKEMAAVIHPRSVKVIKYEGKVLGHPVLRSLNAYLILYALILQCLCCWSVWITLILPQVFLRWLQTLTTLGPVYRPSDQALIFPCCLIYQSWY